jgi:hypothetical protein
LGYILNKVSPDLKLENTKMKTTKYILAILSLMSFTSLYAGTDAFVTFCINPQGAEATTYQLTWEHSDKTPEFSKIPRTGSLNLKVPGGATTPYCFERLPQMENVCKFPKCSGTLHLTLSNEKQSQSVTIDLTLGGGKPDGNGSRIERFIKMTDMRAPPQINVAEDYVHILFIVNQSDITAQKFTWRGFKQSYCLRDRAYDKNPNSDGIFPCWEG